jgi:adenylyl-sulfate kinase
MLSSLGCVFWLTGIPRSGKSTLAKLFKERLDTLNIASIILDGDDIRNGLSRDLDFSKADRAENVRRVGELAKLLASQGLCVIVACISPNALDRQVARERLKGYPFFEIFCNCPLSVAIKRDTKGHYEQALNGQLVDFTGVSSKYEEPTFPDLIIDTATQSPVLGVSAMLRQYLHI